MRLENCSVAACEALEPEGTPPETPWPAAIQAGKGVWVPVGPVYAGLAQVSSRMEVMCWLGEQRYVRSLRN